MPIKATMLIQMTTVPLAGARGPHIAGWSESWYSLGTVPQTQARMSILCTARARLLPATAQIIGQRYQIIDGGSSTSSSNFPGNPLFACDIPQAGLLCKSAGAGVANIRRFTLRGIPDQFIDGGEFAPDIRWDRPFNQFKSALGANDWRFRGRDLSAPTSPVESINAGAVVLQQDLTFAVGDYIQFRDMRDQFAISRGGRYQVLTKTDAKHFTISGWPAGSIVTLQGLASVYTITYPSVTAETTEYVRAVVKKVGRPFEQYRGRGSTRRR